MKAAKLVEGLRTVFNRADSPSPDGHLISRSTALESRWYRGVRIAEQVLPVLFLAIAFVMGAYLRFARLSDLTMFLGDQGRDAFIVNDMIKTHVPTLLGSDSSLGIYKRGPGYYYLLLIPFWLTGGDPVAGAGFNAFADCCAIIMLYILGSQFFTPWVGLTAAGLWAIAPFPITMARFQWNPNPLPLFVMIMIYALWRIIRGEDRFWLLLAPTFVTAWQLHEQSLLLLPAFGAAWLIFRPRTRWSIVAAGGALALLTIAPLLAYEITHRFANLRALVDYAFGVLLSSGAGGTKNTKAGQLSVLLEHLRNQVPFGPFTVVPELPRGLLLLGVAALLWWLSRKATWHGATLFILWLATSLLYSFWPGVLHSYYALILLPLPFLLIGLGADALRRIHPIVALLITLTMGLLIWQQFNSGLSGLRAATSGSSSLGTTELITERILATANGRPYAFRLLTVSGSIENDSSPYRYLLGLHGQPPAERADLDTYLAYRPPEYADGANRQGIVINGVKLVRQAPPRVGANLVVNGNFGATAEEERAAWKQTAGSSPSVKIQQGEEETSLMLIGPRGADPKYAITLIQEMPLTGGKQYLVRFKYRNEAMAGVQRLYFQTRGAKDDFFPSGAGYVAQSTEKWSVGSFIATAAPGTTAATIWLSVNGPGKVWFTDVEVSEVLSGTVIP